MAILQAILLGIIEGLTEFLPISSTGHLVVAERLIGYKDTAELFTVIIQLGAIASVIWYYRKDLVARVKDLFAGSKSSIKFWINLVLATLPAALAGLLLSSELHRFATPKTVGTTLILGGIAIWLVESKVAIKPSKTSPSLNSISNLQAIKIGVFQILSLIPGVSRSASTIMGGLIGGVDRVTATAFSFYLSIPIIIMAGAYKMVKEGDKIDQITGGTSALIAGTIVSFIVALAAIKWLLKYVATHSFKFFAYYRIVIGTIILVSLSLF